MVTEYERAKAALNYLDAGCAHDEWVRIGMAAKSAGLSFDDFHSWSATGSNYGNENECRTKWKSFSESGRVTAATIFAMAIEQGWKDPTRRQHKAQGGGTSTSIAAPSKTPVAPAKQAGGVNASAVWQLCCPATNAHPYIAKKGGVPGGLRVYPLDAPPLIIQGKNVAGWLVVPCWADDKLQTLQFVPESGPKLNLRGALFNDGFFTVGDIAAAARVFIVEGIGHAWACNAATDNATVVCFGVGRMGTVAASLRAKYPTVRLVLVPDRAKEDQAQAIAAAVNCEWCELPADKPGNYDASDFAFEHGADALAELLARTKTPPMRYMLLSGADLLNLPPMRWMVRGVLPMEGLAALYGPSGSGKSFLILDISAAVAGGEYVWFARRVTQCPVTYCALEGEAGMGKRVSAWSLHHKKPVPESLRFVTQPFDLLNGGDVTELAKAIQSVGVAGGLVVLDTLNRAAPGADENSSVDMGNIIAAAKQLQDLIGGLVLLVSHVGKDATRGLRGHSSLYAALDAAIEVTKTDNRREWSVAKSKDDETGAIHAFKLEVVPVGFDDDCEEITSCVAVADESMDTVKRVKLPQGGNQRVLLDALRPMFKGGEIGKPGAPPLRPCIELEAAIASASAHLTCETFRRTTRAREAITGLVARGVIGCNEGWLWLA